MKQLFIKAISTFALLSSLTLFAYGQENIAYTVGVGGDLGSNVDAEFVLAINPNSTYPASPVAAEFNVLIYIPTSEVTGNESFTVLDDNTNGGNMIYQSPPYAHSDGNTYYSFVYTGSGINLNVFGSGTDVLVLSIDVQGGNPASSWKIADASTGLYTDFNIRSALNVLGVNELMLNESGGALPVELLSFEARAADNEKVQLFWQTASELNNDYFDIEHSVDGRNFEVIGQESGAGTSGEIRNYEHWDEQPHLGKNYYRLKQVDFDGSFEYSDMRVVTFKNEHNFGITAFPNPVISVLSVALDESATTAKEMVLYDVNGRVIRQFSVEKGARFEVDVSGFSAGVYFLQGLDQQQLFSEKIVVSRD